MPKKDLLGGLEQHKIVYAPQDIVLSDEELFKVKEAINKGYEYVDLIRGENRLKVNLRNFIYIVS